MVNSQSLSSSHDDHEYSEEEYVDDRWDTKHLPTLSFPVGSVCVQLHQNANSYCHGLTVWDASKVLIKYLERLYIKSPKNRLFVKSGEKCRWLELGAGCGLLGIGISIIGCAKEITLTDFGEVVDMLSNNVALNEESLKTPVVVKELCWGRWEDLANVQPPYDRIACADVLYSVESAHLLAETICKTSAEGTMVLVSYEQRDPRVSETFINIIEETGLFTSVQKIAQSKLDSEYQHDNIFILNFKRVQ